MLRIVVTAVLLGGPLSASPALATMQGDVQIEPSGRPHYTIDVRLDIQSGSLSAHQTVTFANVSDEALTTLVFNATPARNDALRIVAATIGGQPATPNLAGVVLELPLPIPLPPGGSTTATIDFILQVPSPGDLRFGRAKGVVALGNWYPVLSTYRAGQGWDRHRYVDIGDAFVTAVADYDVLLNVDNADSDLVVAHVGNLVAHEGPRWAMRAEKVRDFAMALSSRYQVQSVSVDGTKINAFYLPEHAAGGAVYLRAAAESFHWYNQTLGNYPYPQLSIVETTGNDPGWVGQEFPTIILMGSTSTAAGGGMGDYLSYAVAHEVAHQWFYGLVGDNQLYEPWLDEAFATFLGYYYIRLNYPDAFASSWGAAKERYRATLASFGYRPVNSSIYDFDAESHYYAMVYTQGAMFLEDLRQTMGDVSFWQLLRDFVGRYQFGIATGHSFLVAAQRQAGLDLKPLFGRYFTGDLFASVLDFEVPNGHFYTQANGKPIGSNSAGYSVTNEGGMRFWDEFQRLGGIDGVGYPASRRFVWDGFVSQVFQKGVFQWHPESEGVNLVNVFDQISRQGKDDWLRTYRATPPAADWPTDDGRDWTGVVEQHKQVLTANEAIRSRYLAVPDPVTLYGLPMAPITDVGNAYVLRAQRVIIQHWKIDVPWANAGQVTIANGGDIAKEAGLIPAAALKLEDAPD